MHLYSIGHLRFWVLLIVMLFGRPTENCAQSPYSLKTQRETLLLGGGALGLGLSYLQVKRVAPLSIAQINSLDKQSINAFDRGTTNRYSTDAKKISDLILYTAIAYPGILLSDSDVGRDFLILGIMGAEVVLWNAALTFSVKGLRKRTRPLVYHPEVPLAEKLNRSARFSFFSGHSSTVAALSFFTAKVFCDYHPDFRQKAIVWSLAALPPASVGYLRYRAGKHFPSDVLAGFAVGALVGILIPHIHKKKSRKSEWLLLPSGDKLTLVLRW